MKKGKNSTIFIYSRGVSLSFPFLKRDIIIYRILNARDGPGIIEFRMGTIELILKRNLASSKSGWNLLELDFNFYTEINIENSYRVQKGLRGKGGNFIFAAQTKRYSHEDYRPSHEREREREREKSMPFPSLPRNHLLLKPLTKLYRAWPQPRWSFTRTNRWEKYTK